MKQTETDDKTLLALITLDMMYQTLETATAELELFNNDIDGEEYKKAQVNKKNALQIEDLLSDVLGAETLAKAKELYEG